jgi:aspartate-semialdehyde dehydrogenase
LDNVVPFISGEEGKMESEPRTIFGKLDSDKIIFNPVNISAQCNRVAVLEGHLECVQLKLSKKAQLRDIISAWQNFSSEPQKLRLPTAPIRPIYYFEWNGSSSRTTPE